MSKESCSKCSKERDAKNLEFSSELSSSCKDQRRVDKSSSCKR